MMNSETGADDESGGRSAYGFRITLKALNEQLGEEDMDEWRENAPEKHPSKRKFDDEK